MAEILTLQQVFDKVVKHLLTQNKRCMKYEEDQQSCLYRNEDGLSCAVGCLIPDNAYDPGFEGVGIGSSDYRMKDKLCLHGALRQGGVDINDPGMFELLRRLQSCHDASPPEYWSCRLKEIAETHGLEFKEPTH